MSSILKNTARELHDAVMLLMRGLASNYRQNEERMAVAQISILTRLCQGSCSLTELASHQSVRLPTISRSVSLLVDRGLVTRVVPEADRRQILISITGEGVRALNELNKQAERHIVTLLAVLGETRLKKVQSAIRILREALQPPVKLPAPKASKAPKGRKPKK